MLHKPTIIDDSEEVNFMSKNCKKYLFIVLVIVFLTSACQPAAPLSEGSSSSDHVQVAYVYNGPIGDLGWIYAHEQGRIYLEENLDNIETIYVESVPEGPEAERVIRDLAVKGYDLIFTTTYGFGDPTHTVARDFPDVYFEHCTGYDIAENVSTYFGRMYQARFLTGIVAGEMTESNIIGYIAAFPIPQVVRGINAFTLGVRMVNPEAKVHVIWTQTWFDTVLEREAAESLVNVGADVLAQHQNSPETQKVAEENGILGIGYNTDMSSQAPNAHLTGAIWNWGPYYVSETQNIINGDWQSKRYWGGLEDQIIGLAPYNEAVPDDVRNIVEEWQKEIITTDWDVFDGPLYAQDGALVLAENDRFSDEYLLNDMDWFVQGAVGNAGDPPESVSVAP